MLPVEIFHPASIQDQRARRLPLRREVGQLTLRREAKVGQRASGPGRNGGYRRHDGPRPAVVVAIVPVQVDEISELDVPVWEREIPVPLRLGPSLVHVVAGRVHEQPVGDIVQSREVGVEAACGSLRPLVGFVRVGPGRVHEQPDPSQRAEPLRVLEGLIRVVP